LQLKTHFNKIIESVGSNCVQFYEERLVSVAVFGSVAKGTMGPNSDIDLLLVVKELPHGRIARVTEFNEIEKAVSGTIERENSLGITPTLSAVFKTPQEVLRGSPIFLDMTDTVRILIDQDNFLANYLNGLRERLNDMGAKRISKGGGYYWLLKPDMKPNEEIIL